MIGRARREAGDGMRRDVCSRLSQFFVSAPGHLPIVERSAISVPSLTQSADHKDLGG